jgi:hypothetical protein
MPKSEDLTPSASKAFEWHNSAVLSSSRGRVQAVLERVDDLDASFLR